MSRDLIETTRKVLINEVTDKEINAVKKLSKDMEKIKKDYFKIAKMGDKTLQLAGFNKQYESILKAQQEILKIIGDMQTMKIISDKSKKEEVELEEKVLYKSPTGWTFELFGGKVRMTGKNVDTAMNIEKADFKVLQRIIGQVKV